MQKLSALLSCSACLLFDAGAMRKLCQGAAANDLAEHSLSMASVHPITWHGFRYIARDYGQSLWLAEVQMPSRS